MDPKRLHDIILSHNIPFGSTPVGSAWCVRALHPAHTSGPILGIPDRTCVPSALLEFKGNMSLTAPATTNQVYDLTLMCVPSPIMPIIGATYGTAVTISPYYNPQITGSTLAEKTNSWQTSVLSARIVYYGVTVQVDTPSLYDQGTLVAAQITNSFSVITTANPNVMSWKGTIPSYDNLISVPSSYQDMARNGVYLPMRLSNPSLLFIPQSTLYSYSFPIIGNNSSQQLPALLDTLLGIVSIRNISVQAQARLIIRMGLEAQVPAGSVYSPFVSLPSNPDLQALEAYSAISSKMADGYPAAYNDWDKLWAVIKKVGGPIFNAAKGLAKGSVFSPLLTGAEALYNIATSEKKGGNNKSAPVERPLDLFLEKSNVPDRSRRPKSSRLETPGAPKAAGRGRRGRRRSRR